jgi:hypothetical protein
VLITARLDESTVKKLLGELLPARVMVDEPDEPKARWIQIESPSRIDFAAGEGLRVLTSGHIQWYAAGLPISLTLTSVQLLLRPELADDPPGPRLIFRPSLVDLDLKNVPGFLDRSVAGIVNGRLESQANELAWHFGRALSVEAPMPPTIVPGQALQMGVRTASVAVLDDAIELSVAFDLRFARSPEPGK